MGDKISVIVPIYNVEQYLRKCIDSIINQTYKNLEIILVDDESPDNCGQICDDYAKKDTRIKVIHKKNGGLSDARNEGIKKATGKYLSFIDSDDYIEENMIGNLYKSIIENDSDISTCAKIIEYSNKKIIKNNKSNFCINNNEAMKRMLTFDEIDTSACDKLFKKDLFLNIKFPVGRYYEDMGTIYKVREKANKISHISDLGYHYIMRNDSITKEKFSEKQLDSLYFAEKIEKEVELNMPEIKEAGEAYYYLEMINIKKEYNKKIIKIITNNNIKLHKKIMAIFIYFNLYKIVVLLKHN